MYTYTWTHTTEYYNSNFPVDAISVCTYALTHAHTYTNTHTHTHTNTHTHTHTHTQPEGEQHSASKKALSVVSYVGCAISILSLILTIILLLALRYIVAVTETKLV